MKTNQNIKDENNNLSDIEGKEIIEHVSDEGWTYIRTIVDIIHEPVLILDKNFCVLAANEPFYKTFQVESGATEGKIVYKLGNGQWDIPALRKLLEDILPKNTFFKGFEVIHKFPFIGHKVMILNARQIHFNKIPNIDILSPIILLAIEDVTEIISIAETLTDHIKQLEVRLANRTKKLEESVLEIEKEMNVVKNK
jgi:hypothetical protein